MLIFKYYYAYFEFNLVDSVIGSPNTHSHIAHRSERDTVKMKRSDVAVMTLQRSQLNNREMLYTHREREENFIC